jgi:hypothetical protein
VIRRDGVRKPPEYLRVVTVTSEWVNESVRKPFLGFSFQTVDMTNSGILSLISDRYFIIILCFDLHSIPLLFSQ